MQERIRRQHYSEQRGHLERGLANRFKEVFGHRPATFAGDPVFLQQLAQDRRRTMRRIPRGGKS